MPKALTPSQRREREVLLRRLRFARTLAADEEMQQALAGADANPRQQTFEPARLEQFVYSGRRLKNVTVLA